MLMDRFDRLVDLLTLKGEGGKLPIALALASVTPVQQMVGKHESPLNLCFVWLHVIFSHSIFQ